MPRDFVINGETMVYVQGGAHFSGEGNLGVSGGLELGLSVDQIRVIPRYHQTELRLDDFGRRTPTEIMWDLADVTIQMNLIHYDPIVLNLCVLESMGGGVAASGTSPFFSNPGTLAPCGSLMGNGLAPLASGNHYIQLFLDSPVGQDPWTFPTAYLAEDPVIYSLGTKASVTSLTWRAIPYGSGIFSDAVGDTQEAGVGQVYIFRFDEMISSGVILYHNELRSTSG